jgi:hypothetical protein
MVLPFSARMAVWWSCTVAPPNLHGIGMLALNPMAPTGT